MHDNGKASYIRGQDAVPTFDDRKEFWNAAQPTVGVKVPHVGVRMRVVSAERHVDAGPHRLGRAAGRIDPTGIGASYSVRAP